MENRIYIKDVVKQIQLAGNGFPIEFSIEYRKKDGSYGRKEKCRRRSYQKNSEVRKDQSSIERENKIAGTFKLEYEDGYGRLKEFDVLIPLVVKFNGKIIDHRF